MDDFASDTDSDYTSYWRDWETIDRNYALGEIGSVARLQRYACATIPDCSTAHLVITSCLTAASLSVRDHNPPHPGIAVREVGPKSNTGNGWVVIRYRNLLQGRPPPIPFEDHGSTTQSSQSDSRDPLTTIVPHRPHGVYYDDSEECFQDNFISSRGNEYFCEIDEDYLTDRFNLTGLNTEVQYYQYALDLITDVFDMEVDDDMREQIEKSARHLYGLVHARYIVTTRGLAKMMEKYKQGVFGKCPRVICSSQHLLPIGQHDIPHTSNVKLYCAKCEDIYNPKSSRHNSIDGAYFGTSFHNILFQVYPALVPPKTQRRYEPRIYGFRVHCSAALMRWQEERREEMKERLKDRGVETGFEEEDDGAEGEGSEEDGEGGEGEEEEGIDDMFEAPGGGVGMQVLQ